jgi:hypothetical protein
MARISCFSQLNLSAKPMRASRSHGRCRISGELNVHTTVGVRPTVCPMLSTSGIQSRSPASKRMALSTLRSLTTMAANVSTPPSFALVRTNQHNLSLSATALQRTWTPRSRPMAHSSFFAAAGDSRTTTKITYSSHDGMVTFGEQLCSFAMPVTTSSMV